MGEPATPTAAERASVLAYATALIESVRTDGEEPDLPPQIAVAGMTAAEIEVTLIFRLSQDLVDTRRALERACSALQGNYTTTERDELAERLLKLDLEEDGETP